MLRKIVCASVVLALCIGITLADEIQAVITKVDGGKVTFNKVAGGGKGQRGKRGQGQPKGEEMTLPVADNVKVVKGTFNMDTKKLDAGEAIDKGLKNEMFSTDKLTEKGVRGLIITDSDNKKITEIRVGGGGGRGFKKKDM